ncbi:uncharacterized protein [Leptinotarsa decemlineata]|uniref:uncharacterized protein n=1 Tax=Leptinotarsa decemlineata TaxID=7539 RepID=UPI003D3079B9
MIFHLLRTMVNKYKKAKQGSWTSEATSVARAIEFNRREVGQFETLTVKYDTDAYNIDETGISTTTNKPPEVLSINGKKQEKDAAQATR